MLSKSAPDIFQNSRPKFCRKHPKILRKPCFAVISMKPDRQNGHSGNFWASRRSHEWPDLMHFGLCHNATASVYLPAPPGCSFRKIWFWTWKCYFDVCQSGSQFKQSILLTWFSCAGRRPSAARGRPAPVAESAPESNSIPDAEEEEATGGVDLRNYFPETWLWQLETVGWVFSAMKFS